MACSTPQQTVTETADVTFSDLLSYVELQLREASNQIPQRQLNGDRDLRLA